MRGQPFDAALVRTVTGKTATPASFCFDVRRGGWQRAANKAADAADAAVTRTRTLLQDLERQNDTAIANQLTRVRNYLGRQKIATSDIGERPSP